MQMTQNIQSRLRPTLKGKVKCTLVQVLRLCTGRTAHKGSRGITLPFHDHGTRSGWGVSVTPQPLHTLGKDTVPLVQEAGWAPGPVWTGAENLAPTGIRSPDRSAPTSRYTDNSTRPTRPILPVSYMANTKNTKVYKLLNILYQI
jgi:hypothetical protein